MRETYIYMILEKPIGESGEHEAETGLVKIGRSVDVGRRRNAIQTCSPRDIEILTAYGPFDWDAAKRMEKDIHTQCAEFHVKGEWFTRGCERLVRRMYDTEDLNMNIFEKQDIQTKLKAQLKDAWVLSTVDLEVTDKDCQVHKLDVALHTGEFVFGRVTIGSLTRANLDGVEEIQCSSFNDVERCVEIAVNLQEKHCRSQVVQMVA